MKVIVVIPSRFDSSRFPGKPLAEISGKPMIRMVYEAAIQAETTDDVYVATDDPRIVSAVEAFGAKAVQTAKECRSGTDRVADTANILGLADEDILVNVQGDQPLIHPASIDQAVSPFLSGNGIGMSTLACRIEDPRKIAGPKDVKVVMDKNGYALYFSRSPIPFARDQETGFDTYKHLGVYVYTKAFLDIFRSLPLGVLEEVEKLEQLRALEHGYRIRVLITEHNSPEVDYPEDIKAIENLMNND